MYRDARGKALVVMAVLMVAAAVVAGCVLDDGGVEIKKYDPEVVARVNAIVDEGMQKGSIPGALVCVWNEGYETLLVARGMADIASGRAPRITDSFRIGSNTKVFTATALLMLADQGKVALDDKLSKYLPDVPHAAEVTVRQIGNHTAGYYNFSDDDAFFELSFNNPMMKFTPQQLLDIVKDKPLNFTPGTKMSYSNTGFVIIGMLVEKLSGMTLKEFVAAKILKPLGLNETYSPDGPYFKNDHLSCYIIKDTQPVEFVYDPSWGWAAGDMISTVGDMKKWLDAVRDGRLLSPAMAAEQKKWVDMSATFFPRKYGFGLMRAYDNFIGHGGSIDGSNTLAIISLDGRKCVIIAHNLMAGANETGARIIEYLGMDK